MKSIETSIIENIKIAQDFYKLRFFWDKQWGVLQAGNFCEIKVNNLSAPLLRRPFAFSDFNKNENFAEIIYQKRGTATQILVQKKGIESTVAPIEDEDTDGQFFVSFEDDFSVEKIHIIAPLGNSFYYTSDISAKKRIFAVAGGIGLGPILFAAKTAPFPVELIAGFKSENLVPGMDVFYGIKTKICTDDGSDGFAGNVVEYLKTTDVNSEDLIIACGPQTMLETLHSFAVEKGIACKVSMEGMMACGVGACMGCVIQTKSRKYKCVCKDGPVFNSDELLWDY
ncbi:MAG: dihydroorotate dehydrogenase electron transfer subunit [Chitinispirillales bacterium]|nr:dihydroorotate dehydrogenase electron transfer subunit [Chitinispirillales bacterium]